MEMAVVLYIDDVVALRSNHEHIARGNQSRALEHGHRHWRTLPVLYGFGRCRSVEERLDTQ